MRRGRSSPSRRRAKWGRAGRGRPQSRGRAVARASPDLELADRRAGVLQLDLETARDRRLERDLGRLTRRDVLYQVVPVHVHLVRDVGIDTDDDVVAVVHGEVLDAAGGLSVLHGDVEPRARAALALGTAPEDEKEPDQQRDARDDEDGHEHGTPHAREVTDRLSRAALGYQEELGERLQVVFSEAGERGHHSLPNSLGCAARGAEARWARSGSPPRSHRAALRPWERSRVRPRLTAGGGAGRGPPPPRRPSG